MSRAERELLVVRVTNDIEANPEYAEDTARFPELVGRVEDEYAVLVVDPETREVWPADEFFLMELVRRFRVVEIQEPLCGDRF